MPPTRRIKEKKQENKSGQLFVWDFTLKKQEDVTHVHVADTLRKLAKHWAFQLEEGALTQYRHWQGRLSLRKKARKNELINLMKNTPMEQARLSTTANANKSNFDYVLKLDTKVDGPWTDKDINSDDFNTSVTEGKLQTWQQKIIDIIKGPIDERQIIYVLDRSGKHGKSWLCNYIKWKRLGTVIPPMNNAQDISQMIMCKPADRAYTVDVPRSTNQSKLQEFWTAMETIKNGYCYDKRHKFQDRNFKTPHLIVFGNAEPKIEMLSDDRWRIIDITKVPTLQPREERKERIEEWT